MPTVVQLTSGPGGRILTNSAVWSPDQQWIVFDSRSDPAGDVFDGTKIQVVHTTTREVRTLYESKNGACCGVASWHPLKNQVVFILGPEQPTPDFSYAACRRQGVMVSADQPGQIVNLDARNLESPYTPGALRGGTHLHMFNADGQQVCFTYEDHVLESAPQSIAVENRRNIGVSVLGIPVQVPKKHPRNHDGNAYSVLVTQTNWDPKPGSDEYQRAFEEAWVGTSGYLLLSGTRQNQAIAFQGHVRTTSGTIISEVFVVDLPDSLTHLGTEPVEGTPTQMPAPPRGAKSRRLTHTANDKFPGIQGPRHWLRSSSDGSQIGFLKKDDQGIVQFWTVSPNGGPPRCVTRNLHSVASAFTWHPDGKRVAFVMDGSVCVTKVDSGETRRLTARQETDTAPRPEACVFSPDGKRIAFVQPEWLDGKPVNQICIVSVE
jgi:Tol biopolymer transport system component